MQRLAVGVACCGLALWGCSDPVPEKAPDQFPAPIQMIEEAAPPLQPQAQPGGSLEFECAEGAFAQATLNEVDGARDRRAAPSGETYAVVTYFGEGVTVFGLQPVYVERLMADSGWQGAGAYLETSQADLAERIRTRFPDVQSADGWRFTGGGLRYPIVVQPTDTQALYVVCAPGF